MRFLLTSYLYLLTGVLSLFAQSNVSGAIDASSGEHQIQIDVPRVSLVQVVDNAPIHIRFTAPTEAGKQIVADTTSQTWLNYSFVKGSTLTPVNHVYVRVGQGQIPQGVVLKVLAMPYTGLGDGDHGQPAGEVAITNNDQKVVEDIGSSYTGAGIGNGHLLQYKLEVSNYSLLDHEQDASVQLVYTISE